MFNILHHSEGLTVWYKNTIIEVKEIWDDARANIQQAILNHFGLDIDDAQVYSKFVCISVGSEDIMIRNELLYNINYPYKIVFEENPDDYWGTCTAKNLPCDRVPVQQPMAYIKC